MAFLNGRPQGLARLLAFPAGLEKKKQKKLVIAQYAAPKHTVWTGRHRDMVQ